MAVIAGRERGDREARPHLLAESKPGGGASGLGGLRGKRWPLRERAGRRVGGIGERLEACPATRTEPRGGTKGAEGALTARATRTGGSDGLPGQRMLRRGRRAENPIRVGRHNYP